MPVKLIEPVLHSEYRNNDSTQVQMSMLSVMVMLDTVEAIEREEEAAEAVEEGTPAAVEAATDLQGRASFAPQLIDYASNLCF